MISDTTTEQNAYTVTTTTTVGAWNTRVRGLLKVTQLVSGEGPS